MIPSAASNPASAVTLAFFNLSRPSKGLHAIAICSGGGQVGLKSDLLIGRQRCAPRMLQGPIVHAGAANQIGTNPE
jgi:hypothetical protein